MNQLCSNFFWNGSTNAGKRARVSWKDICYPKAKGGLGLKNIQYWNQACMIQHLWSLFSRSGSIWIAWIEAYKLKGRSMWQVSVTQNCSWSWRKLLQMRDLARQFVIRRNDEEVWRMAGSRFSIVETWQGIRPKKRRLLGKSYCGVL